MFCNSDKVDFFKQQVETRFTIKNIIVWDKGNHTAGDLGAQYGKRYEFIIYANKGRAPFTPDVPRYDDVWAFPRVTGAEQIHQNQKPIPLLMRIVKQHTKPHDIILDPFMGSCSTAVAATSVVFYLGGTMELLNAVVMIISAFILFGALDSAGSYSAMLKNVDLCVSKAQSVLTMPTMDTDGRDINPSNYDIDVGNVEFSYDERKIIDGVSVHIPEKTTTAIVGPSGGGKTTLCHLIARFWDVDKGNIKLGGHNVKEYCMDSLMRNFSFVFQNVYLFQDTIANNIRFGQPDASMEKVIEAAKKACCHDFITALPDGYETVIGEGGASLSGAKNSVFP